MPLLSPAGAQFYMGLLPMVLGLVFFVVFSGTVLKLLRRQRPDSSPDPSSGGRTFTDAD